MTLRSMCVCLIFLLGLSSSGYCEPQQQKTSEAQAKRRTEASQMTARPNPANPGSVIVFEMNFVENVENLKDGSVVITDSQGNSYRGQLSGTDDASGNFVTSIRLSPLLEAGELLFEVLILDQSGNLHKTKLLFITIT